MRALPYLPDVPWHMLLCLAGGDRNGDLCGRCRVYGSEKKTGNGKGIKKIRQRPVIMEKPSVTAIKAVAGGFSIINFHG